MSADDFYGSDYRVYQTGPRRWWSIFSFPFTVVKPGGGILDVTLSLWGAKRAIRRHKADRHPYWESPVVHRERPGARS